MGEGIISQLGLQGKTSWNRVGINIVKKKGRADREIGNSLV